ncbi:hypothetical protein [Lapillicoccus sp.]|uniref:O-antigen ligase family protein n=1 Tax=Lapillicoccus sp. TaxID=1909287 RepID=UPI003262CF5B
MLVAAGAGDGSTGLMARSTTSASLRELTEARREPHLGVVRERPSRRWLDRLFAPGWPLAWMFVAFPLWWVLGLTEWAPLALTVPMVVHLLKRRRVEVPKGFGFWLLFLVWSLAGAFVLSVPAFGAVIDSGSTRIITFGYRLVWYLACTIVCLYILNTRGEVSRVRVTRIFAMMFIWVTAGGVLGLAAPNFEFPSLMELILPSGLTDVQFIYHMIHPSAAQLQDVLGYTAPRPSAPFSYTNTWGVNLAVLMPFFVMAWFGKGAGWRRAFAPLVMIVAFVAIVISLNRGLWVALAATALFLAVRACLQGKPAILAALVVAAIVGGGIVQFTPLSSVIADRFSSEGSISGRTNLGTLSVESVTKTSPLVGLGSTRNVQGNFNSIAGGATAQCPRCSPPALGTQGQLWLVVFCQGLLGLFLYLAFFVQTFLRSLRARSGLSVAMLCVLVLSTVTMPVYNSLGTALVVVFAGVGLLAREQRSLAPDAVVPREASLGSYGRTVTSHWALILVCTFVGIAAGGAWQAVQGTPVRAVVSVVLPEDRTTFADDTSSDLTIDSEAQFVNTAAVDAAATAATKPLGPRENRQLRILATPNSRVLHISYIADHQADAVAGAQAAAKAFASQRDSALQKHWSDRVVGLQERSKNMHVSLTSLATGLAQLQKDMPKAPLSRTEPIRKRIQEQTTALRTVDRQLSTVLSTPVQATTILRTEPTKAYTYVWLLSLLGGMMSGLLLGLMLAARRGRGGGLLGARADVAVEAGVPVLLRQRRPWWRRAKRPDQAQREALEHDMRHLGVTSVVPVRDAPESVGRVAALLPGVRHAIVCTPRTRWRDLQRRIEILQARGGEVVGIVMR